ncbi:hypothetical protein BL253_16240 [Pseudofrankia asymbiotica]|uniref:Uncharacterized protein n=2 Tax=Pseudofrankia asymbiotica TaxID=1834516 RepID=A0A1V2IA35_9ACTN|nr:hypothetical protein BL253_16240 [Pseudofrankia asymbiotica]
MELATQVGATLLVFCSGRAKAAEVLGLAAEVPGLSATVVDLSAGYHGMLFDGLATSAVRGPAPSDLGDLSTKRNLGLLAGAAAGWRSMLFLDDDIRDIRPRLVLTPLDAPVEAKPRCL